MHRPPRLGRTATALRFDVTSAEDEQGIDPDDALFVDLAAGPYLVVERVEVLEPAGT